MLVPGNATVERGFSVNDSLLVENLQERSLIAQRVVYDSIKAAGGVLNVEITREMLRSVNGASARYKEALEERRKEFDSEQETAAAKKRSEAELKELQLKRRRLEEEYKKSLATLESQISDLRKQH